MDIREFARREGFMKVSIDGILQSAKQLKGTINVDEHKSGNKNKVMTDRVSLEHKVLARLDEIHVQIKDIQTTLSRFQVIDDGIKMILEDRQTGNNNTQTIMQSTLFNNRPVLKEFLGDSYDANHVHFKHDQLKNVIADTISQLNRLEIEFENIVASDVARNFHLKDKVEAIDAVIPRNVKNPSQVHTLASESVFRLIQQ